MRPAEILDQLSKQAKGSMGDFLSKDEEGMVVLDLDKAEALGSMGLIERLVIHDVTGADGIRRQRIDIKLYSAQRALVHMGKVYDMFRSGTGGRREALPPHEVDDPGNVKIYPKDHSKQLVAAINRFIKETFGSDMASGAYWRAVVYGFVPNPVEHGLPEGVESSRALEGYMKLDQFYLFCIETTTMELKGLKREPREIFENALRFGFVEGPYPEGRLELGGGDRE
jgi:hypothetical protein